MVLDEADSDALHPCCFGCLHPSGRILNQSGNALAGATLTLSDALTEAVLATTLTDANGNYSFNAPTGGNYRITPTKIDTDMGLKKLSSALTFLSAAIAAAPGQASSTIAVANVSAALRITPLYTPSAPKGSVSRASRRARR